MFRSLRFALDERFVDHYFGRDIGEFASLGNFSNYADCKNFVNADLIAQGMAPFSPETAALRAGRTMLEEIRSFAERRVSFAFETTLSRPKPSDSAAKI
jgi:predicted ABC-type ATPase